MLLQFESGILDICLRILDTNPKCLRNPGKDCSGRRNPIYVSRVLSAMVRPDTARFNLFTHNHLLVLYVFKYVSFIGNLSFCMWKLSGRWTVMTTKECCWENGRVAMMEEWVRCFGGAVFRFCVTGTKKRVSLFAMDSAGCSLRWPAQVK